jgi:hypothetical protein
MNLETVFDLNLNLIFDLEWVTGVLCCAGLQSSATAK